MFSRVLNGCIIALMIIILGIYTTHGCLIVSTIGIVGIFTTIIRIEERLQQFMEERRR